MRWPCCSCCCPGSGWSEAVVSRVLQQIRIEPFLSTKSRMVSEASDGWTLVGARGNLSAQYEHTMIITQAEPIVVTRH